MGLTLFHRGVSGAKVLDVERIKHAGVNFWKSFGLASCGQCREDATLLVHVG
jgi:hypothetical protein